MAVRLVRWWADRLTVCPQVLPVSICGQHPCRPDSCPQAALAFLEVGGAKSRGLSCA